SRKRSPMKSIIKPITTILLTSLLFAITGAQSSGSLRGLVGHAKAAAVKDARVVMLYSVKLTVREARTGEKGELFFYRLRPGNYTIAVEAVGLTQSGGAQSVRIEAGREFRLIIPLVVATIQDAVIISATRTDSPTLETPASSFIASGD